MFRLVFMRMKPEESVIVKISGHEMRPTAVHTGTGASAAVSA